MKGVIVNFRRGKTTQKDSHMVIQVESVSDRKKAESLVGKKIVFTTESGKKQITGKVAAAHGKKGAVRAIFEKGMPGQAIGKQVSVE
jgi:large subunit ribosomal protein L35Ae